MASMTTILSHCTNKC